MSITTEPETGLFGFSTEDDRADVVRQQSKFTEDALERHKRQGLELAVRARVIAMGVIAVMLAIIVPWPDVIYYLILDALFVVIGLLQRRVGRVGASYAELALLFCDLLLMTIIAAFPNPFSPVDVPLSFQYESEAFKFFFLILAMATLAYSWRTIIAVGTWTVALWAIAAAIIWYFNGDHSEISNAIRAIFSEEQEYLWYATDPTHVKWDFRIQDMVAFMLCAVILAVSVRRSNNLLLAQAAVERERANLARYFSPNVVDQLSTNDTPLKQVAEQEVAVLFVDIVGFTSFSASRTPQEVIQTLREFHEMMEREVFRHGGTLDKYLGDGLMATFGTPFAGEVDALDALRCSRTMALAVEEWNKGRVEAGHPAIRASFGVHTGPVVLGDIGANRLEFAVIGNTVNVASRLESLSRPLGVRIVASDSLVQRARHQSHANDPVFENLVTQDEQEIRGVDTKIRVWTLA